MPETPVTCIFVINGREVFRRDMPHPGMEEFILEWDEADKSGVTKKRKGRFYWYHMDQRRNQIFRLCTGYVGEIL